MDAPQDDIDSASNVALTLLMNGTMKSSSAATSVVSLITTHGREDDVHIEENVHTHFKLFINDEKQENDPPFPGQVLVFQDRHVSESSL
jgi:hypothetical protein